MEHNSTIKHLLAGAAFIFGVIAMAVPQPYAPRLAAAGVICLSIAALL